MSKRDELLKVVGYVVQTTCRSCVAGHGFQEGALQGRCSEHDEVVSAEGSCPLFQRSLRSFDGVGGDMKFAADAIAKIVEQIVNVMNATGTATGTASAMVASLAANIGQNHPDVIRLRTALESRRMRNARRGAG